MARKRRVNTENRGESSFEIDLSPLLALMVTLIPMMLLATVFVKITVVETPLPQAVKAAIEKDRKKKKRETTIELKMNNNKGFDLVVKYGASTKYRKQITGSDLKRNLETLHNELVVVKKNNIEIYQILFKPADGVSYQEIVKVMDASREFTANDPKLYIKDKETNESVELKVMFPDLIFNNILEG